MKKIKFLKNKQIVIFYVMLSFLLTCLIIGIVLLAIGKNDYNLFVIKQIDFFNQKINQSELNKALPDISMFVYGIFFIVLTILLIFATVLYGNSTFNKKYKKIEEK